MKKTFLALLLLLGFVLGCLTGCDLLGGSTGKAEFIDYAAQLTLDMNSETNKQEVTVKNYIDGDTTHFNVPTSIDENGVLKARYLACNTPESTGKIEPWGKKASNFTKEKLLSATSIILETDGATWEKDSTGERFLVWVWYKAEGSDVYRNLNLELLQNGLAVGSKAGDTRYGALCTSAINNAGLLQLHVYGDAKDPDFHDGPAEEMDLKYLRLHIEEYEGQRVAFNGTVTQYSSNGVYVEDYNEVEDRYYGIYLYYGFTLSTDGEDLLEVGNRVRIVGKVSRYESQYGTSWQICDLFYDLFNTTNPNNIQLLETGCAVSNVLTTPETFNSKVEIDVETADGGKTETYDYAYLALQTSISMQNLIVTKVHVTATGGNNDGALTLTCKSGDETISVRTPKLYDENKNLITAEYFNGKTINLTGVVEYFNNQYQVEIFELNDIEFVEAN